jgi:hypothetical protein
MMILLGAVLVLADPDVASPQAVSPVAAPAPATAVKEKKICKNLDGDTGTHMSRRTCKTADEWGIIDRDGGKSADDMKTMGAH